MGEDAKHHDGVDDEHDGPVHHGPELEEVEHATLLLGAGGQQGDQVLLQMEVEVDEEAADNLEGGEEIKKNGSNSGACRAAIFPSSLTYSRIPMMTLPLRGFTLSTR